MNEPPEVNRQIVLARRPNGPVDEACFEHAEGQIPVAGPEEAIVKTKLLTIDPAIRGWLNERGSGYLPGIEIGAPIRSSGIGEIVESNVADYPVGVLVTGMTGWQDYAIVTTDPHRPFQAATVLPADASPIEAATVFSHSGWTAYVGMRHVLNPAAGDDVLVTSGASLIGSLAGQLAIRSGARVVGTAGSDDKCAWCVEDLGFTACINYRTTVIGEELKALFPSGIDMLFDNVGGSTLDAALRRIAVGARIALCGSVSTDDGSGPYRLANYDRIMSRRATMLGFNTIDHLHLVPEINANYRTWLDDGTLTYRANVFHGLERAPEALVSLYQGSGIGKTVIEV